MHTPVPCTTPVRTHRTTPVRTHRATPVRHYIKCVRSYAPASSKSEIKDGLRTCSAFLLNNFSRKRLSEGVTNCAIIIALNVSLRTFSLHFTLTMSLRLAIKATQEEAGERTLPKMLAISFFSMYIKYQSAH